MSSHPITSHGKSLRDVDRVIFAFHFSRISLSYEWKIASGCWKMFCTYFLDNPGTYRINETHQTRRIHSESVESIFVCPHFFSPVYSSQTERSHQNSAKHFQVEARESEHGPPRAEYSLQIAESGFIFATLTRCSFEASEFPFLLLCIIHVTLKRNETFRPNFLITPTVRYFQYPQSSYDFVATDEF